MSILKRIISIIMAFVLCYHANAQFRVYTTPVVPLSKPVAGHFSGELNRQLWTWGGYDYSRSRVTDSLTKYSDSYAFGASVEVPHGTLCIGGTPDEKTSLVEVFLSRRVTHRESAFSQWQYDRGAQKPFPALPKRLHNHVAAYWDGYVYVLGGQSDSIPNSQVYRLEWPNGAAWDSICVMPGVARINAVAIVQENAYGPALYVFGGTDSDSSHVHQTGLCLNLNTNEWRILEWGNTPSTSLPAVGACVRRMGHASVVVIGGVNAGKYQHDVLVYNTYTDSWATIPGSSDLARAYAGLAKVDGFWFINGGETKPGVCSEQVTCVEVEDETTFSVWNYGVILLIGLIFVSLTCTHRGMKEKQLPWWGAGISAYMATFGGVSLWFLPYSSFAYDWSLGILYLCSLILFLIIVQKRGIIYLKNVEPRTRLSLAFSVLILPIKMGLWLLLPSFILSQVIGIHWGIIAFIIAIVPIICVRMAERRMLIYLDVLQFCLMMLSVLVCVIYTCSQSSFPMNISLDLENLYFMPMSVLVFLLIPFVTLVSPFLVRRVYETGFAEGNKSTRLFILLALCCGMAFLVMGSLIHAYYQSGIATLPLNMEHIAEILPAFAVYELPIGLSGLFIATLIGQSWCALIRLSKRLFNMA